MPPIVIVDVHPHRHVVPRALRPVAVVAGGLLYAAGLVATVAFVALGFVLAAWQFGSERDPEQLPLGPGRALGLWLAAGAVMVLGLRYGRRLVRGRRATVLYLRRFRDDASMAAVTGAARRSLGGRWRLVSLDDARLVPVGLSTATSGLFSAGRFAARVPRALAVVWRRAFLVAVVVAAVSGFLLYDQGGVEALLAPFDLDGTMTFPLVPRPAVELTWDASGAFFVSVVAIALLGQATIVAMVVMFGVLVLMPLVVAVSSWSQAETWARANVRLRATGSSDVDRALAVLRQMEKKILAPRLVVLTVATPIWQETVRRLAAAADACLVDVSEPSANVVWELEHLRGLDVPCHFVGERPDLERLARAAVDGSDPAAAHIADLLAGREVLAYTTDRRGLGRFAGELRLTMDCPVRATA
ncbi:hypothetical protein [Georgenia subflava]|uniref:Uncharacterized protein n=1 Tax=Georgenia subflava TaxID=1622177 RepID=A0A6N7ECJ0_9MICO|nr:hypothetical protein [Georgenia subflava]MPV35690.1 hypothetical protein [Georgenia subflava]